MQKKILWIHFKYGKRIYGPWKSSTEMPLPMPVGYSTGMPTAAPRQRRYRAQQPEKPYGQPQYHAAQQHGNVHRQQHFADLGICPVISGSTGGPKTGQKEVSLQVDVFMIQTPHILFFI